MSVYVREKHGKFYLDVYWKGKRAWESTGLSVSSDPAQHRESKRLAEILRSKREHQLVSADNGLIDPIGGKQTLVAYAEAVAETTPKKSYLRKNLVYLKPFAQGLRLAAVDESWLERYRDHLERDSGLASSTSSGYFQSIKTLLKKAERDRLIPRNPATNVRGIRARDAKKIALTAEELKRLAANPVGGVLGAEIVRGFLFASMVGLRISDIRALTWGNIERLPTPRLSLMQKKTKGLVFVPLNSSAWKLIDDGTIHKADEKVFNLDSKAATNDSYFRRWAKLAGIEKHLSWHISRHTFAVLSLESGTDLYTVSKLLGHTNIGTTEVYARATDPMKRRAVDALPEIGIKKRGKA